MITCLKMMLRVENSGENVRGRERLVEQSWQ